MSQEQVFKLLRRITELSVYRTFCMHWRFFATVEGASNSRNRLTSALETCSYVEESYAHTFGTMSGLLTTRSILTSTKCPKASASRCSVSFAGRLESSVLRPWVLKTSAYSLLPAQATWLASAGEWPHAQYRVKVSTG